MVDDWHAQDEFRAWCSSLIFLPDEFLSVVLRDIVCLHHGCWRCEFAAFFCLPKKTKGAELAHRRVTLTQLRDNLTQCINSILLILRLSIPVDIILYYIANHTRGDRAVILYLV